MTPRHYDEISALGLDNLQRLLRGRTITFGDPELGQDERRVTIRQVRRIVVGLDRDGLFCGVAVRDDSGCVWVIYSDGSVCDVDGRSMGRCDLRLSGAVA